MSDHINLAINGWSRSNDSVDLFQMMMDAGLEFVASERAPYNLVSEVCRLAHEHKTKVIDLWGELISEGFTVLMKRWRGNPETHVGEAYYSLLRLSDDKARNYIHGIFEAYDSQSGAHLMPMPYGSKVAVFVSGNLHELCENDDDPDDVVNVCSDWGLDFGDFCCVCAGVAVNLRGGDIPFIATHIEGLDRYVRSKVWLSRVLIASNQPISMTTQEQADDILFGFDKK